MRFRNILPVILAIAALSSCSVYRSGQTPDDVYFSPAPTADDSYLTVDNPKRGSSRYNNSNPEDNYLSMRQYGSRWSQFDSYNDWQYNGGYYGGYSPYTPYSSYYGSSFYGGYGGGFYGGYGIGMPYAFGYYNPWAINTYNPYFNSYYYWNSFYNPYAGGIIVGGAKNNPVAYRAVRNFNMSSYTNGNYNTRNTSSNRPIYTNPNGRYNTSNNNGNTSGGLRRSNDSYYNPTQRSSSPAYTPSSAPVRTYSPSSGGSYGGGSGGGGGSSPSRPSRGH